MNEKDICEICKHPLETTHCKLTIDQPSIDRTVNTRTYNICYDCLWKLRAHLWGVEK